MFSVMNSTIHILVAFMLPPLLLGVINRTKAVFAGRNGPPLIQPYYDLIRLFQKGSVFSTTTTWVFRAGPVVGLVTVAICVLMVPMANSSAPISFKGDLILLVYLLALSRFFTASAALDTGSPFEGMGAAREVTYACLAEPALFFGLLVLAKLSGELMLSSLLSGATNSQLDLAGASLALVFLSWSIVLLVENCRIPFDDPNTHLELTMIHEVMVLDHSGPAFGMILYAAALKLFLFSDLIVRLGIAILRYAFPNPLWLSNSVWDWLDWPMFVVGIFVVAIGVGVVESVMARLRLTHIPTLLVSACLLSAFGILMLVR